MFQQDVLSLEEAQSAVAAMLEKGKSYRGPIAVAVVDASTQLIAFARMDGCTFHHNDFAYKKAFTAVYFSDNTSDTAKKMHDRLRRAGEYGNEKVLFLSGGVVVKRPGNRQILGGIGVSGLSGEEDEEIALAGLKAMALT